MYLICHGLISANNHLTDIGLEALQLPTCIDAALIIIVSRKLSNGWMGAASAALLDADYSVRCPFLGERDSAGSLMNRALLDFLMSHFVYTVFILGGGCQENKGMFIANALG